jgi:O-antigen/teichoic acid export membrane protein
MFGQNEFLQKNINNKILNLSSPYIKNKVNYVYSKRSERTKKYLLGASTSIFSQSISTVVALITTGILTRYFSSEEFGIWSILTTFFSLLLGLDLGFGNALKNKLSEYYANNNIQGNEEKARQSFYSILYVFLFWTALFSLTIFFLRSNLPWYSLIKTQNSNLYYSSVTILTIAIMFFSINSAFQIYTNGFYAYQETHFISAINTINKILFLVFIVLAVKGKLNFSAICIIYLIIVLITSLLGLIIFINKRKWTKLSVSVRIVRDVVKSLYRHSIQFTLLQIVSIIATNIDIFLISNKMGLTMVGDYSLVKKIYLFSMSFHVIILFPLWPAFTEAVLKKDNQWVKKMLIRIVSLSIIIFSFIAIFLFFFGDWIVYLWSGKVIHLSLSFLIMGIYFLLFAVSNCLSVFLNSINKLKWQILIGFGSVLIIIPLANYLFKIYGINGLIFALIIISVPGVVYLTGHTLKILKTT